MIWYVRSSPGTLGWGVRYVALVCVDVEKTWSNVTSGRLVSCGSSPLDKLPLSFG